MRVAVVQSSTLVSFSDVTNAVAAIQRQVNEHLAPAWGAAAELLAIELGQKPPEDAWCVQLLDVSDIKHVDGYHAYSGRPSGVVGIQTSLADHCPWTVTLSHELLELIVDPWGTLCMQTAGRIVMLEVCDPVEGQSYSIDSVAVEDFVLPAYYRVNSPPPWNYNPAAPLSGPLALGPQGYTNLATLGPWSQTNAPSVRATRRSPGPLSRRARRWSESAPREEMDRG